MKDETVYIDMYVGFPRLDGSGSPCQGGEWCDIVLADGTTAIRFSICVNADKESSNVT